MKRPLIKGKDFQTSIGQGGQVQGGVIEAYQRERGVSCVLGRKRKRMSVRKRLILMCGKVLFMGKMCANKSMERNCV